MTALAAALRAQAVAIRREAEARAGELERLAAAAEVDGAARVERDEITPGEAIRIVERLRGRVVDERTIRRWVAKFNIGGRVGGRLVVNRARLEQFLSMSEMSGDVSEMSGDPVRRPAQCDHRKDAR